VFNFIKASIGAGSFALPWALAQAGVVAGSVGLVVFGAISMYTMQLMLDCKALALAHGYSVPATREFVYTDVGRAVGRWGVALVNINVIMCNLGACAGYLIFIGSNLRSCFLCVFPKEDAREEKKKGRRRA
jgi:amino acid permease